MAKKRLADASGLQPGVQLVALVDTPASPAALSSRARLARVARVIARDPDVRRVQKFYGTHDRTFVARDGRSQYAAVSFKPSSAKQQQDAAKRIDKRLAGVPGVRLGGGR